MNGHNAGDNERVDSKAVNCDDATYMTNIRRHSYLVRYNVYSINILSDKMFDHWKNFRQWLIVHSNCINVQYCTAKHAGTRIYSHKYSIVDHDHNQKSA